MKVKHSVIYLRLKLYDIIGYIEGMNADNLDLPEIQKKLRQVIKKLSILC